MPIRWDNIDPDFSGANYLLSRVPQQIGGGLSRIGEAFDDTTARRKENNTNIVRQNLMSLNNLDTLEQDAAGLVAGRNAGQYNVKDFQDALSKRRENLVFSDESKFKRDTRVEDRQVDLESKRAQIADLEQGTLFDKQLQPGALEAQGLTNTGLGLNNTEQSVRNEFLRPELDLGLRQGQANLRSTNIDNSGNVTRNQADRVRLGYMDQDRTNDLRMNDANYEGKLLGNDQVAQEIAQESLLNPGRYSGQQIELRAAQRAENEERRVEKEATQERDAQLTAQDWTESFFENQDNGTVDTGDDRLKFNRDGAMKAIRSLGLPPATGAKMLQTMKDQAGYTAQQESDALNAKWGQEMDLARAKNRKAFTPGDPRQYSKVMASKSLANMMDEEGFSESTRRNIGNFLADLDLKGNYRYKAFATQRGPGTFVEPLPEDVYQAFAEVIQNNGNEFYGTDFPVREFQKVLMQKVDARENQEKTEETDRQKADETERLTKENEILAARVKKLEAK